MNVTAAAKRCVLWRRASLAAALAAALLACAFVAPAQAAVKKGAPVAARTAKAAKPAAAKPAPKAARKADAKAAKKTDAKQAKKAGVKTSQKQPGGKAVKTAQKAAQKAAQKGSAKASAKGARARVAAAKGKRRAAAAAPVQRMSVASALPRTYTPMELSASAAYVLDQDTHEVLLRRNEGAVLPIASITKLMTGLLIVDAKLPLQEFITITHEDVDTAKGSSSRLQVGATLTRGELLHLALMSSENRAAHALGRTYPGGLQRFVSLMNARAMMLGMHDTRYVEPTGLSSANRSSARDLATLVAEAARYPLLRELTTSPDHEVVVGARILQYSNTNRLVRSPEWNIALQKTGYIAEAGRCLVMQTRVAGRRLVMVLLDSKSTYSRLADAERVRQWVEEERPARTLAAR